MVKRNGKTSRVGNIEINTRKPRKSDQNITLTKAETRGDRSVIIVDAKIRKRSGGEQLSVNLVISHGNYSTSYNLQATVCN